MDSKQQLVADENVTMPLPRDKFIHGLKLLFPISAIIGAIIGGLFGWLVLGWGLAAVLAIIGGAIGFFALKAEKYNRLPLVLALINLTTALIIMPAIFAFGNYSFKYNNEGIYAGTLYGLDLFQFFYLYSVPILTGLSFLPILVNHNQMSRYMIITISQINVISILIYFLVLMLMSL